jgi:hypothetical protein
MLAANDNRNGARGQAVFGCAPFRVRGNQPGEAGFLENTGRPQAAARSGKGGTGHQLLVAAAKSEEIELAGIMFLGSRGKPEFDAQRGILVFDLVSNSQVVFEGDPPPEGHGDSTEQNKRQDRGAAMPRQASCPAMPDSTPN